MTSKTKPAQYKTKALDQGDFMRTLTDYEQRLRNSEKFNNNISVNFVAEQDKNKELQAKLKAMKKDYGKLNTQYQNLIQHSTNLTNELIDYKTKADNVDRLLNDQKLNYESQLRTKDEQLKQQGNLLMQILKQENLRQSSSVWEISYMLRTKKQQEEKKKQTAQMQNLIQKYFQEQKNQTQKIEQEYREKIRQQQDQILEKQKAILELESRCGVSAETIQVTTELLQHKQHEKDALHVRMRELELENGFIKNKLTEAQWELRKIKEEKEQLNRIQRIKHIESILPKKQEASKSEKSRNGSIASETMQEKSTDMQKNV